MVKLIQLPIYKDKRKKNRIFTKKKGKKESKAHLNTLKHNLGGGGT